MKKTTLQGIKEILAAVDTVRQQKRLTRHQVADTLGIPFNTFRAWFHKRGAKTPSSAYVSKLQAFAAQSGQPRAELHELWNKIREWWQTQHRYASLEELSEEVGWPVEGLRPCLLDESSPPRLVAERIAQLLHFETPVRPLSTEEVRHRVERLKALLIILSEELGWFRDGPEAVRNVFRSELDQFDTGYLSSLLNMLFAEDKFRRWLEVTTNRFNYFRRKEGKR
jgi:transcriptional regulator with XRE-family HTH domain